MKNFTHFLSSPLFLPLVGLLCVSIIVWFGGPKVSFGETVALENPLIRILLIVSFFIAWGIHYIRKKQQQDSKNANLLNNSDILAKLRSSTTSIQTNTFDAHEVEAVRERFKEAKRIIRKAEKLNGGPGSLKLHELPLYVIIGPPGSGKTTAIANSGLKFPLEDSLGKGSVPGIAGTRHCDWWFTEDAVLIDTAGRYTTHDSNQESDKSGWQSFIKELSKNRSAKALNGVIVTLSLPDLIKRNDSHTISHVKNIKLRLSELREQLKIDFPVYFVVTKIDMVNGFTDFFGALDAEKRNQVWGFTFDYKKYLETNNSLSTFEQEYENLIARLNQHVLAKMQAEVDKQKRANIFAFPQEMSAIKPVLKDFFNQVFIPTRLEKPFMLRGVYFTSGTQAGTPIDNVLSSLATTYGMDTQKVPSYSGAGKSYFLTNTFKNVIFPEANLGAIKSSYQLQSTIVPKLAYAASIICILTSAFYWAGNYSESAQKIDTVQQHIDRYLKHATNLDTAKLMPPEVLASIHEVYGALIFLSESRNALISLGGLDQSNAIGRPLEEAYLRLLDTLLKPSVANYLEHELNRTDTAYETQFSTLKTYLSLSDSRYFDSVAINNWFQSVIPSMTPGDPASQERLKGHIKTLTDEKYQPFLHKPILVESVRSRLNSTPLAERVYARLRLHEENRKYDIKLGDLIGSRSVFEFKASAEKQAIIPGFFTYNGFHNIFLSQSAEISKTSAKESWVLGETESSLLNEKEIVKLKNDVQRLYLAEYASYWRSLLDSIQLATFKDIDQTVDFLSRVSDINSPLLSILNLIRTNTALSILPESATGVATLDNNIGKAQSLVPSKLRAKLQDKAVLQLESEFSPYSNLVAVSEGTQPIIDDTISLIGKVRDSLKKISQSPNLGETSLNYSQTRFSSRGNDDLGNLRKHSQELPLPVRNWVAHLSSESWRLVIDQTRVHLNEMWAYDVYPEYERNIKNRYPIVQASGSDIRIDDFSRFFGPDGTLDSYRKKYIESFINTRTGTWSQKSLEGQSLSLPTSFVQAMQNADYIKQAFFRLSPDLPQLEISLKPRDLDAKVSKFTLDAEGSQLVYRHGPTRPTTIKWPGGLTEGAKTSFETESGREIKQRYDGVWALFRLIDGAKAKPSGQYDKAIITFTDKNYSAEYEVQTRGAQNPFVSDYLQSFRIPKTI